MSTRRKKQSAAFKAQVAIEAIKESETLSELVKRFEVYPQMISNWKREFLTRGAEIFSSKAPEEEAAKREKELYEKIGHLEVEVDFCKSASDQGSQFTCQGWIEYLAQIVVYNGNELNLKTRPSGLTSGE